MCLAVPLACAPYLYFWESGLTSDAAIPYLMARHIIHRHEFALFFWGNSYMGAVESYLSAGLIEFLNIDRPWISDIPPALAYCVTVALLIRQTQPSRRLALAIPLVFFPPALYLAIARPGFSQGTFLWLGWGALSMLLPDWRSDPFAPRASAKAIVAGLVLALSTFYISTALISIVPMLAVVAISALRERAGTPSWSSRAIARTTQIGIAGAMGYLGIWVGRFAPQGTKPRVGLIKPELIWGKLKLLSLSTLQFAPYYKAGASITGLNSFYSGAGILEPIGAEPSLKTLSFVTVLFALALFGLACLGIKKSLQAALDRSNDVEQAAPSRVYWSVLLVVIAGAFVVSNQASEIGGARYLAPAFIPLAVLAIEGLFEFKTKARALACLAWCATWLAGTAYILNVDTATNRDIDSALSFTISNGVQGGSADYWLAFNLNARSREELIFVPREGRYPPYLQDVASMTRPATIQFRHDGETREVMTFRNWRAGQQTSFGDVLVTLFTTN